MTAAEVHEAARIARDTRAMEIEGIDGIIRTLAKQVTRMPENSAGANRLQAELARMIAARRALQLPATPDDLEVARAHIDWFESNPDE